MTGQAWPSLAWRDGDIVTMAAMTLAGLIAIVVAWFGAGGSGNVTHQAMWLNLAVAGFGISALGNCLWLLRGRKAVGERRVSLISFETMDDEASAPEGGRDGRRPAATQPTASLELVRGAGMTLVHYRDCPLLVGKPVQSALPGDGQPCGMCAA